MPLGSYTGGRPSVEKKMRSITAQPTICVFLTYRTLGIVEGLRRLDNNWVVGVCGEAERADGGEGGEARGLEGDDVDSVRGGLQVDEVEWPGER